MKSERMLFSIVAFLMIVPVAAAMINPAAVYCNALGYEYITTATPEGGERGACRMGGGVEVDAWEFLQGKAAQNYSYCAREGYELREVHDANVCIKFLTESCAVCVLGGGREVEVTELMGLDFRETTCGDGSCGFPENYENCPEDCPSGGMDEYCDRAKDGKCDPDCEEEEDADCGAPLAPAQEDLLPIVAVLAAILLAGAIAWRILGSKK